MMRIVSSSQPLQLMERPFAGGIGASLYVGDGDPSADPGPTCIVYRRPKILNGGQSLVSTDGGLQLGAASIPKTALIAQVDSPTEELEYTIPAALYSRVVWAQVRTFLDDVENETIYKPRRIVLDGSGAAVNVILGTARVTEVLATDGGGILVRFSFDAARDGIQPTQFSLVRTAGPTSPAGGTTSHVTGQRRYELQIASLQDAGAYTFKITASNGATSADLVTGIAFTADGAGPPAVTGLAATEY